MGIYATIITDSTGTDHPIRDRSGNLRYGVCQTAASITSKTATLEESSDNPSIFILENGSTVHIKFNYTNTATNPTLNINNSGAKPIKINSSEVVGTTIDSSWKAGSIVNLTYDATNNGQWIINNSSASNDKVTQTNVDGINEEYKLLYTPPRQTSTTTSSTNFDSAISVNPYTDILKGLNNIGIKCDSQAQSGEDYELYTALNNLGWWNDVNVIT